MFVTFLLLLITIYNAVLKTGLFSKKPYCGSQLWNDGTLADIFQKQCLTRSMHV